MRSHHYLRQRYAVILFSLGLILLIGAAVMLTPLLVLLARPDQWVHTPAFAIPVTILGLAGLGLRRWFGHHQAAETLSLQEGGVIVVVGWALVIVASAWPFMAVLGLTFSQAVFESVSGWTTTGLSVVDVTAAGPLILLWRSIMQLAGGAGLAILMMSAIVGPTGIGIASAEGRADQLVPHVRRSARLVLAIYGGYAVAGTVAYRLAGMSLFDALNHAFAAVSTGGFSTHPESLAHWDSAVIEAVSVPLMICGNLSFVTAWLVLQGRLGLVARNGEVRLMAAVLPASAALTFVFTCQALYPRLDKALRVAVFETVSALTTTGFQSVTYGDWNGPGIFILILLMLIGGGTCSTAGGLKQFRVYLMCRLVVWEIRRGLLPRSAIQARPVWEGHRRVFVDDARVRQVAVFVFLYLATYAAGSLCLAACGFSLSDSLFEFASAIGTVGLSIGVTTAGMPLPGLWAETLAMFFGRLEFIVIFISLFKLLGDCRQLASLTTKGK